MTLTKRGRKVVTALILLFLTMAAAFWIEMQALSAKASQERMRQIVNEQIQEDDGPQDGSTDCWTVEMCDAR